MKAIELAMNEYYANNARKLRQMADKILQRFGGISDKDYHDFYSIANEVFVDVMKRYDGKQSFHGFLYSCLLKKFESEITSRNRIKRRADRNTVSLDAPVGEEETALGDTIPAAFDVEAILLEKMCVSQDGRVERYLSSLNQIQRKILEWKMKEMPIPEIKKRLGLSDKQYNQNCEELRSFANINLLYRNEIPEKAKEDDVEMVTTTQTMEKSKPGRLSIASIIKKIDKYTIRFDHPLQRGSEQWSPSMKGNLISDILQGNPIPSLVFAEQVVNGIAIIWDLDGKQRCTNTYSFAKDGYKITKNIRRWMIEYQSPVVDENGNMVFDEEGFPVYEKKEFDIRGRKFSELPEELQDKFTDYNFEIVQYLNCSSKDIAYHIARYNEGKPMTASQKGMTRLGEEYAGMVKSISNMSFFKDMGGYKVSEFKNGTINRVVVESVMAAKYLKDWKKKQEDMCEYVKDHASCSDFDDLEDLVGRLEKVMTNEVSDMFDSRDSFLWFGLFARFVKLGAKDEKFIEFMKEFARSLHSKKIDSVSYDDLNGKSTKDKKVVIGKMEHLEKLLCEFLDVNREEKLPDNVLSFVKESVDADVTQDDIDLYEDCLSDLTLKAGHSKSLLERQNHPSLVAIVAYACVQDIDIDHWFVSFFQKKNTFVSDQKANYLHMVRDLNRYIAHKDKKGA